jgi:hypothetical protein
MRAPTQLAATVATVLTACAAPPHQPNRYDEGHGALARASTKLLMGGEEQVPTTPATNTVEIDDVEVALRGEPYGGYGDAADAMYRVDVPHYDVVEGLTGVVEGSVRWRGELPGKRQTPCGELPAAAIDRERGLGDVLVYVTAESVVRGRSTAIKGDGSTLGVGGLVVHRACALVPTLQVITPVPSTLTLHSESAAVTMGLMLPSGKHRDVAVERAGRATVPVELGITKVTTDGAAPAYVHGIQTPYYAITDDRGRFRLDELAPGAYELVFWHAPLEGSRSAAPLVTQRRIVVSAGRPARVDVSLGQ